MSMSGCSFTCCKNVLTVAECCRSDAMQYLVIFYSLGSVTLQLDIYVNLLEYCLICI